MVHKHEPISQQLGVSRIANRILGEVVSLA